MPHKQIRHLTESSLETQTEVDAVDPDQFAQTREPDNLFDDDFTPITEPMTLHIATQSYHGVQPESHPRGSRSGGRVRGRGRERHREQPDVPKQKATTESKDSTPDADAAPPESQPVIRPTYAARGNRLGTGGIQRPKLTEEELSAKLEAAKLNNARREEAHRAAEADEASFLQRERVAEEKRKEEGVARRAMDMEREKNRMRKLGARGGREWDEGKKAEEETFGQRRGGYRRGAHGGVVGDRRQNVDSFGTTEGFGGAVEELGRRGRGRGGFDNRRGGKGRGGGGARGRGDEDHNEAGGAQATAATPANFTGTDFPALEKKGDESRPASVEKTPLPQMDGAGDQGASWADQVEAGT